MENFEKISIKRNINDEIDTLFKNLNISENIINKYNERIDYKNPHIDPFLEIILLLTKYLINIISCLNVESELENVYENNKTKMLRLYDFISYEFKRLRNKYEDLNDNYFNYDEEYIFLLNIKRIYELEEIKESQISDGYLNLFNNYLIKFNDYLHFFQEKLFQISPREMKKLKKLVYFFPLIFNFRNFDY